MKTKRTATGWLAVSTVLLLPGLLLGKAPDTVSSSKQARAVVRELSNDDSQGSRLQNFMELADRRLDRLMQQHARRMRD